MKLIFKGKFISYDALPKGELPENAVKFKEPKTMTGVNCMAMLFMLPVLFGMIIAVSLRGCFENFASLNFIGLIISFVMLVPHEFIHALCMGKDAEVYMYYSLKHMMMFVITLSTMSKARFIVMSLMPALVLGVVPFLVGIIFFPDSFLGGVLMTTGFYCAIMGGGDFMNVFNAAVQMPKGSLTQLSGMNSYWFMPEEKC